MIQDRDRLSNELRDSYDELFMRVDTSIKLESVILSEDNRNKVNQFIKEMKYAEKLIQCGLNPMNRLLFYGDSGCGKTFLSKALANTLGYTMLYVDIAKSLSDGNIAKNISNIFALGNKLKHCIIFFDECDSIAWNRDSSNAERGDIRRATNSIFQNLDQMDTSNIFIAATNMRHRLDEAFIRRFDMDMEFRKPDSKDIMKTAMRFIKLDKFDIVDDVDIVIKGIIEKRCEISYYTIEGITMECMKNAVINESMIIHTKDLYELIKKRTGIIINYTGD